MTTFSGFQSEDFEVFSVEGLDERMEGIKDQIRPKLTFLGEHFAPQLGLALGDEMFYHVAKHARRTVNPPKDTWVAWANDKRGYKKHPHFQIGLWGTHLFVWYALIYESPFKQEIGQNMEKHLKKIISLVPGHFQWSPDHMQPHSTSQVELGEEGLLNLIQRLQTVKKAEILCGITIDKNDSILRDGEALVAHLEETFQVLTRLYMLNRQV
ncbi:DUF1054 domain-containing protein [Brevibacillus laterosporus]|nr:DUF1054 domain-containing protein [Brevibacillus laterosporus]TPG90689.1 DUF1054 domain-containing protein [Brevibacillus laterosporus]